MYRSVATTRPLVVVTHQNLVIAYDRRTGAEVWKFGALLLHGRARTTIADDRVLVAVPGIVKFGLVTASKTGLVLTCLDYATGRTMWQQSVEAATVSPSVLVEGDQVLVSTNRLCAFALADGTPQWQTATGATHSTGLALPDFTVHADHEG